MKNLALVIDDRVDGSSEMLSAQEFESRLKQDPALSRHARIEHPENQIPVVFRSAYYRNGFSEEVSAHWAYARGYAPKTDHLFDDNQQGYKNIGEALSDGAKVLLSLNFNLSHRILDFSQDSGRRVECIDDWKSQNRYLSYSVNNINDAVSAMRRVQELGGNPRESISASYGGAVVPYEYFYTGRKPEELVAIYSKMSNGKSGISLGQTRQIGFPRLMRFVPAKKTLEQGGSNGIKGGKVEFNEKALLSYLIFSEKKEGVSVTEAMERLNEAAAGIGVYVLASPVISTGHQADKPEGYWRNIRWVVNDVDSQIRVPDVSKDAFAIS